mmetsp:Transcript_71436/g.141640  ORF Transcript_71436/g.141640 Transcript_71436/m.141640 type:complete len:174 (-) Transcript_71436:212-733(-)
MPSCKAHLTNVELRLASPALYTDVKALRQKMAKKRSTDFLDENPSLLEWAFASTSVQCCPHCAVLVQRSEGCQHMTCTCGGEFCFICGEAYPCNSVHVASDGRDSTVPTLRIDLQALRASRTNRRVAFTMGLHVRAGDESVVQRLPPDLVQRIGLLAVPPLPTLRKGTECYDS